MAVVQASLAKAFDPVNRQFLFEILRDVNLRAALLDGLKSCYRNCVTRLVVNRAPSRPIPLSSSVKKGCSFSPILFALYLEPLFRSVIYSTPFIGFCCLANELKVLAYADDVAFLLYT